MEYEINDAGQTSMLTLRGRLTFEGNEHFRTIVDNLAKRPGRDLDVDISELDFIDSAGLGLLLLLKETIDANAASLTLCQPQGQVKRLLAASHFERVVPVKDERR